jgi:hypothetical protein
MLPLVMTQREQSMTFVTQEKAKSREIPTKRHALPRQNAFVVQFAADATGEPARFFGRAEHVMSGQVSQFSSPEELVTFLAHILGTTPPA